MPLINALGRARLARENAWENEDNAGADCGRNHDAHASSCNSMSATSENCREEHTACGGEIDARGGEIDHIGGKYEDDRYLKEDEYNNSCDSRHDSSDSSGQEYKNSSRNTEENYGVNLPGNSSPQEKVFNKLQLEGLQSAQRRDSTTDEYDSRGNTDHEGTPQTSPEGKWPAAKFEEALTMSANDAGVKMAAKVADDGVRSAAHAPVQLADAHPTSSGDVAESLLDIKDSELQSSGGERNVAFINIQENVEGADALTPPQGGHTHTHTHESSCVDGRSARNVRAALTHHSGLVATTTEDAGVCADVRNGGARAVAFDDSAGGIDTGELSQSVDSVNGQEGEESRTAMECMVGAEELTILATRGGHGQHVLVDGQTANEDALGQIDHSASVGPVVGFHDGQMNGHVSMEDTVVKGDGEARAADADGDCDSVEGDGQLAMQQRSSWYVCFYVCVCVVCACMYEYVLCVCIYMEIQHCRSWCVCVCATQCSCADPSAQNKELKCMHLWSRHLEMHASALALMRALGNACICSSSHEGNVRFVARVLDRSTKPEGRAHDCVCTDRRSRTLLVFWTGALSLNIGHLHSMCLCNVIRHSHSMCLCDE
jgi:hypothetical protein